MGRLKIGKTLSNSMVAGYGPATSSFNKGELHRAIFPGIFLNN